jgi:hypothetical protein
MYTTFKHYMPDAIHIYGPMVKSDAFNTLVPAYATQYGIEWYVGTTVSVKSLASKEIFASPEDTPPSK